MKEIKDINEIKKTGRIKRKWIVVVISCLFIVLTSGLFLWCNPEKIIQIYFNIGNYDKAIELYNEIVFETPREEEGNEVVMAQIEKESSAWLDGKNDSERTISVLKAFLSISNKEISDFCNSKMEYIKIEVEGRKKYSEAEKCFEAEKYVAAAINLLHVEKSYSEYNVVMELYTRCKGKILEMVSSPETVEEYEKCIESLNKCLKVAFDKEFSQKKEQLSDELIVLKDVLEIIQRATNLYENSMYEEAFVTLALGLEKYPENDKLAMNLIDFHEHYVIFITKQVTELREHEEYSEALDVLKEAISQYDCEEFHLLEESVKEQRSVLYQIKNNIVAKFKMFVQGCKEEKYNVKQMADDTGSYIIESGEKLLLGEYSDEDITVLSIAGNAVASLAGVDILFDLRDVTYDIMHWGEEECFAVYLTTDVIALLPVIGVVKYFKHFKPVTEAGETTTDLLDSIADVQKNTEDAYERVKTLAPSSKILEKAKDVVYSAEDIAKRNTLVKQIRKNVACGYEFVETTNCKYLGSKHPSKGVEFVLRKLKYSDGTMLQGVFPKFKSFADINLPKDLYKASFDAQKKNCMKQLKWQTIPIIGKARKNFTKDELELIANGKLPNGYTWHHNEMEGLMQLVKTDIHKATAHTGGMSLWGKGH